MANHRTDLVKLTNTVFSFVLF